MIIEFTLNHEPRSVEASPDEPLPAFLRRLGPVSVKVGCDEGCCGTCTVLLDGNAVMSCLLTAGSVHGRTVRTVESLGDFRRPHPLQSLLVEAGAVQCGFCIPGLILSAVAAVEADPHLTDDALFDRCDGHLCRCTGYEKIQDALRRYRELAAAGEDAS